MNARGSLLDYFVVIAIVFLVAVVAVVCYAVLHIVDSSTLFDDEPEAAAAYQHGVDSITAFDNLIMFILVGLSVFVLVSGYFAWNHPVMMMVSVFVLVIAIVVSAMVSNAFILLTEQPSIAEFATPFPKTIYFFTYFPLYILLMGFLSIVTMYVSYRRTA